MTTATIMDVEPALEELLREFTPGNPALATTTAECFRREFTPEGYGEVYRYLADRHRLISKIRKDVHDGESQLAGIRAALDNPVLTPADRRQLRRDADDVDKRVHDDRQWLQKQLAMPNTEWEAVRRRAARAAAEARMDEHDELMVPLAELPVREWRKVFPGALDLVARVTALGGYANMTRHTFPAWWDARIPLGKTDFESWAAWFVTAPRFARLFQLGRSR